MQGSNQKVDWTNKRPKTPKEGSTHKATRCPRARNVKSIEKSKHPKGNDQSQLNHTPTHSSSLKKVPRTKTKLRGLPAKQTSKVPRPSATVRLQLAPFRDWRGL